jgi:hypothetical protein
MEDIYSPEFRALNREASLAAHLVSAGVTTLNKANSGRTGLYAQAFFELSIGLERVAKLAILLDHMIDHDGTFPTDQELRTRGHDVDGLVLEMKKLRTKYPTTDTLAQYPTGDIETAIVKFLSTFAKSTRYYNLDYLVGGRAKAIGDPISTWWATVGKPILEKHYKGKRRGRDEARAMVLGALLDPVSMVQFTHEEGAPIADAHSMLVHSDQTGVVQKWAPLYVLRIIRFSTVLVSDLSDEAGYKRRLNVPDMGDHFRIFYNEDSYLKTRKTWEPI